MTGWPASERSRNGGVDRVSLPDSPGGLFLCGKHFVGPDPEGAIARVGATVVVCLSEEPELDDRYPEYVSWLRVNQPARAVWFPIPDLHAPAVDDAEQMLEQLRARLEDGATLLVHCGAGIGRAGTIAAALLITMGLELDDALATVAAHRPTAGPEVGAQADLLTALAAARA